MAEVAGREQGEGFQEAARREMCCCFIACQENQEQVHRWDLGSREPSRSDHLSTPWLSRGLGSELPAAVALLGLVPT